MESPPPDRAATARVHSWIEVAIGLALIALGLVRASLIERSPAGFGQVEVDVNRDYQFALAYGVLVVGVVLAMHGVLRLAGYKAFVALRYLLVAEPKVTRPTKIMILIGFGCFLLVTGLYAAGLGDETVGTVLLGIRSIIALFLLVVVVGGVLRYSKPSLFLFLIGAFVGVSSLVLQALVSANSVPFVTLDETTARQVLQVVGIASLFAFGLAGLAIYVGMLRAFFTFFTTVPICGVWIGTSALVCVLAVMSGFETDLRDKILGSNAHIQITREDGEFVNWREAKAKIDKIPGVVASTPYAVSEVVIAANNNGMNVIIKGIDPATVAKVTDLVSDLEDPEAMRRLEPLIDESHDRTVPQTPRNSGGLDPPPDDMVTGGDPIDFSGAPEDAGAGSADPAADAGAANHPDVPAASGSATGSVGDPDVSTVSPYGGDATRIIDLTAGADPLSSEVIRWMVGDHDVSEPAIHVIDIPLEPSLSRRTQALPGILVGRELVKQTHLYTGEEVRVVSPLSDPSNPDATGTPIPFNRDYRVAGIFYTGMYEYDLKYVYVTLDSLQDFLDRGESVDGIEVRIEDADDTERYVPTETNRGLIQEALGSGYRIQDWRELNRSLFSALKLEKIAMFLVLGIVILVASFSIVGNLIMVVVEKAREIALLKTLGASDVGVMQLFAIQGLLIGLIGTSLGIATGLLGCWAGKRFGLPLNPDVYYIDRLPIHVDPQSVAAAALTGVLISIGATLYPALLGARVRPAAGMRH